ncbi:MAG TPA: MBL fold metallo-hydrolase [Candidatus Moranbacteria bacterium]|jgi:L-ascorbate metabolism protein UlaG (beta-lactamase superfamily)|nr:MBL fold metallo-hydrolase [Candidatus Moranbacteria bacterium]HOF42263.1 MBL fold metallo-hydrolase [Candidatus Moranbacteria bacterium]HPX94666.1 MBL fold metallo-hydrolase [Candidatus Moranbacteria bacterium]HQB59838.1 MBL fold metallo-hydrolase [Candidatus Moranbacteria bacterium]
MIIQYYGHSCFKITTKPAGRATEDVTVFFDPFDKNIGLRPPQGQADVVFVSHDHHDHNNVDAIKGNPIVIDAPGEYAVKGINAIGIDSFHDDKGGAERGRSTIFILEAEDLKICHLGDLGCDISGKQLEEIYGVDVLFIPIGGKYTIDGKKAAELVRNIEPVIVIPTHYKIKGLTIDVDDEKLFCTEMGSCPAEKVAKLNIKKKDLEGKNAEVVLMNNEQ